MQEMEEGEPEVEVAVSVIAILVGGRGGEVDV